MADGCVTIGICGLYENSLSGGSFSETAHFSEGNKDFFKTFVGYVGGIRVSVYHWLEAEHLIRDASFTEGVIPGAAEHCKFSLATSFGGIKVGGMWLLPSGHACPGHGVE